MPPNDTEIISSKKSATPNATNAALDERKAVFLLCLLAVLHVFIYAAAFPTFNVNDEAAHFDLTIKYSRSGPPRTFSYMCDEWMRYYALFGTPEYFFTPEMLGLKDFPSPIWKYPINEVKDKLLGAEIGRCTMNTESSQPPLFYTLAGAWWRLGEWCGFHDGYLCYWLRFINVILVPLLVWMGYFAAKSAFPEFPLIRLGVPALLAVMPQTVFYSVTNDILSPITFGLVFICIIRWFQSENPGLGLGFALGGALAATFLTKLCNLPLIGTAGVFLLWDAVHRAKSGNLRPAIPPAMCLAFSAIVPMVCWAIWCRHNFGDFTGSETKIKLLGWTHKPVNAWVPHPLFTPRGAWIFIRDLLASFWRGEFLWHRQPLASHFIDLLYVLGSLGLMMTALPNCFRRASPLSRNEGRNLLFSFSTLPVSMAFFAFLSLIYDFHFCFYPSHDHPYFTSGRLMLGAAIPILVVLLYGLDRVLEAFKGTWARWFVLAGMMALMLAGEIVVDWPVFYSQYNWFHLQG